MGGGVANSLNDASHLPHLAELFITLYYTCCELTEGSPRRNHTFTSSIQWASSQPGIVQTRKRVESGECVKFKQITYFSGDKSILYLIVRVLQVDVRNVNFTFVKIISYIYLLHVCTTERILRIQVPSVVPWVYF